MISKTGQFYAHKIVKFLKFTLETPTQMGFQDRIRDHASEDYATNQTITSKGDFFTYGFLFLDFSFGGF